jgi:hypothetical protein
MWCFVFHVVCSQASVVCAKGALCVSGADVGCARACTVEALFWLMLQRYDFFLNYANILKNIFKQEETYKNLHLFQQQAKGNKYVVQHKTARKLACSKKK